MVDQAEVVETKLRRQLNYKQMRVIVGVLAFLIAPVCYLLADAPNSSDITSISITYWTGAHDVFVGSLIAVAFFLFSYNGSGKTRDLESVLSKIAGFCALCIALFPTTGFGCDEKEHVCDYLPSWWVENLTGILGVEPATVHGFFAIVFFICLILMMRFFSKRAETKGKYDRAFQYKLIYLAMLFGIITIALLSEFYFQSDKTVLYVEIWGLSLFGIGWLRAGMYLEEDAPSLVK